MLSAENPILTISETAADKYKISLFFPHPEKGGGFFLGISDKIEKL